MKRACSSSAPVSASASAAEIETARHWRPRSRPEESVRSNRYCTGTRPQPRTAPRRPAVIDDVQVDDRRAAEAADRLSRRSAARLGRSPSRGVRERERRPRSALSPSPPPDDPQSRRPPRCSHPLARQPSGTRRPRRSAQSRPGRRRRASVPTWHSRCRRRRRSRASPSGRRTPRRQRRVVGADVQRRQPISSHSPSIACALCPRSVSQCRACAH